MTDYERKEIEAALEMFTSRNFVRPSDCRNPEQIRFYARELYLKIQELEGRYNYVPAWVYALLAQYNARQNSLIHSEMRNP